MKTLALAAIFAALGTSAYADHGWNNGGSYGATCGGGNSSYGRAGYPENRLGYEPSFGYARTGYVGGCSLPGCNCSPNGYFNSNIGYGPSSNSGNAGPWSYRSSQPSRLPHVSYDTYYDGYRRMPYTGFGRAAPRSNFEPWPNGNYRN